MSTAPPLADVLSDVVPALVVGIDGEGRVVRFDPPASARPGGRPRR